MSRLLFTRLAQVLSITFLLLLNITVLSWANSPLPGSLWIYISLAPEPESSTSIVSCDAFPTTLLTTHASLFTYILKLSPIFSCVFHRNLYFHKTKQQNPKMMGTVKYLHLARIKPHPLSYPSSLWIILMLLYFWKPFALDFFISTQDSTSWLTYVLFLSTVYATLGITCLPKKRIYISPIIVTSWQF